MDSPTTTSAQDSITARLAGELQNLLQTLNPEALALLEEKIGIHGIESCDTRMGLTERSGISFDFQVAKGGTRNLFEAMVNGLSPEEQALSYGFLMGLEVDSIQFNPKSFMMIGDKYYFRFSIGKNEEKRNEM